MENKYYTPKIEEFHPGFIFDLYTKDGYWDATDKSKEKVWVGEVISKWRENLEFNELSYYNFGSIENAIRDKLVRVKYLDKEDIEKEGWKEGTHPKHDLSVFGKDFFTFIKPYKDPMGAHNEVFIYFNPKTKWLSMSHYNKESLEGEMLRFSGCVKNISEFRKLMKMINV